MWSTLATHSSISGDFSNLNNVLSDLPRPGAVRDREVLRGPRRASQISCRECWHEGRPNAGDTCENKTLLYSYVCMYFLAI